MNMHHPEMALAARHVVAEAAKGWKMLSINYFRGLRTTARNRKDALVRKRKRGYAGCLCRTHS